MKVPKQCYTNMTAEEWEFNTLIYDYEDQKAMIKMCSKYHHQDYLPPSFEPSSNTVKAFIAGFYRGLAWAKAKYGIEE